MNRIFEEAMTSLAAFDPALLEMQDEGIPYLEWVQIEAVPRAEVIRTSKALLKACWKRANIESNPLLVEMGIVPSKEDKMAELKGAGDLLQEIHAKAHEALYGRPPAQRIGYYTIRSGTEWIEISNLESAQKQEIQEMAKTRVTTSYLK